MKANLYNVLSLFSSLLARAKSVVLGRPYNGIEGDSHLALFARAQKRYDFIVPNEDLVNRAPPLKGEPLMYVQETDHAELRTLGAVEKEGKWYLPPGMDDLGRWVFARWFAKAAPDLATSGTFSHMTVDGRSTNGYVHPSDQFDGGDSTATSLVMGGVAVLSTLMYVLYQFRGITPIADIALGLLMGVGVLLLLVHAYTLYQCEDAATMGKVLALSIGVPLVGSLMGNDPISLSSLQKSAVPIGALGLVVMVMSFMSSRATNGANNAPLQSTFSRLIHAIGLMAVVVGVNVVLSLLPPVFAPFKPFGLFLVACAYPYFYTRGNRRQRTAELLLQSLQMAGPTHTDGSATGKLAPARQQQIREAARDTTTLVPIAEAQGVMAKIDLPSAPDAGQWMCLSLLDFSMHQMVFGNSGVGKTMSVLFPEALRLKMAPEKIGAIVTDGKNSAVEDLRSLLDIVIEPGVKFAPFQGMTAQMVASAYAESNGYDSSDDSIWQDGANAFNLFSLKVLEALKAHEMIGKDEAKKRLASYEYQIECVLADREILRRSGQDTAFVDEQIDQLKDAVTTTREFIVAPRQYKWCPTGQSKIKDTLSTVVKGKDGMMYPNNDTLDLFEFLGAKPFMRAGEEDTEETKAAMRAYQERLAHRPQSIHPDFLDTGRVLSRAADYFNVTWPNTDDKQRSSFLMNVNRDILGFMQSDDMRGSTIDGKDCGEEAWADTEEGEDVLRVLFGAWLGINLSEIKYGHTAKVIAKLVKSRVFNAIQIRQETYGSRWRELSKEGKASVMDMMDECQVFVSPMEMKLSPMARSMGLFFIYATQKFEGLAQALGSEQACNNFLEDFASVVSFRSSARTYQYLQVRAGKAKKLRVPTSGQAFLNTDRAIETYQNTIFADPNHPSADLLRDLDRRGGARLQVMVRGMKSYLGLSRKIPLGELSGLNCIPVYIGGELEEGPILEDWELTDKLNVRGSVLVMLNRAGHPRIDFARTKPLTVAEVEEAMARHKQKSLAA